MHDAVRIIAFVVGLAVLIGAVVGVFTTLIVPRASSSRLLRFIARVLGKIARGIVGHLETFEAKDRVMAIIGPLAMMILFVSWLLLVTLGFGLMTWWTSGDSLGFSFVIAGSSVFTLGIATGIHRSSEVLEIAAAGTGLLIVAIEIGYLPTLYAAFSQREEEVTLLATRAGVPAWGPEVLARHYWFKTMAELPDLYRTWERWAAEVFESHTNYPSLVWFRSPLPTRSWLTGLVAMMDAAALHDACAPGAAPRQARLCLQMGMNCLRGLAQTLRIEYEMDPLPTSPVRLTYEEFVVGYHRLEVVNFPLERDVELAWRHFSGWRVNYESIVDALTVLVMPPPAPWFLDRPHLGEAVLPRVLDRTPDDPQASANPE
jgi:hypothetical protein